MEQIKSMSWRNFLVLLNNLSPYGAVAMRIRAENELSDNETDNEQDEKDADKFFSQMMSI